MMSSCLLGKIVQAPGLVSETEAKLRTKATGRKLLQPQTADRESKQMCRHSDCHDT